MYTFTDGTATGGADYSANTTNTSIVTFPPGSTEECIAVNILNDLTAELNEVFTILSLFDSLFVEFHGDIE